MIEPSLSGRFLSVRDVMNQTSLSRATIYRLMANGQFPKCFPISPGRVSWHADAIEAWKNRHLQRLAG
ncbi:AlpA family phage regulatory protein [Altererythrobacter xixiisoli]|uniref:AlpA family phage regulatory protein n=1 Tax=Croceibacterium xixiisoli TaxID=1476466 RepID=A0A6I4TXQ1_9SPHN|nr:AlpA family phage regulatory protein [Croceibacterium xixiisoli]MXP00807.1 AlpA family phage regulatory protein [Croceibacterium xixiisoli]